jgi:hypothetical protein
MANSNGWGDGAGNNAIGWGQGANNNIGWGDSHAKSWAGLTDIVGIDTDAQAFITAAAITDPVQINAINTLVEGMKTDGIWTKMKAIYPFVGGTASTHKWNLKDPRDLDAAFRLVFNGGWTHSSNGATPNGTNGFADTKLTASGNLSLTNSHLSFYSRTNSSDVTSRVDMGRGNLLGSSYINLFTKLDSSTNAIGSSFGDRVLNQANSNSACYALSSSISSTSAKLYKNGSLIVTNTTPSTGSLAATAEIYIGSQGNFSAAAQFSNKQCAFSSIGDGLTDTEAANLYTRVQAYQTALSRQV